MEKIIKRFSLVFLAAAMIFLLPTFNIKAYAVEVGQQLVEPEEGWQRIDDSDKNIIFDDSWTIRTGLSSKEYYNGTDHYNKANVLGSKVTFKFKGTKFRIIAACNNGTGNYFGSQYISLNVDGENYNSMSCFRDLIYKCILCDVNDLDDGIHTVTVTNNTSYYIWFDAIDIDKDGRMLDANKKYVESVNLNKKSLIMNVGENKLLTASVMPEDADDKSLIWTSSDTNICIVDESGKITAVGCGNAVITAKSNDGSEKSESCKVTVVDNSRAILNINMNNGKSYSYDLTMTEISSFDKWYMNRANGEGSLLYKLTLQNGDVHTMNYNSISDYVVHKYQK